MSDSDRGAYTPPTDSPLSFDARRPVRGGGGGGGSTLVISAVILILLVAGAGFWLYKDGRRGADDAPQPVGATIAGGKVAPNDKDQPEVDSSAGLTIHKDEDLATATPGEPTFAPAPEAVQPRPQPSAPVQSAQLSPVQPAAPAAVTPTPAPKPAPVVVAKAPAAQVTPVAPKPVAAGGSAMVQIGAFSSQALADRGWSDAASVAPGLAAGKGKKVEAIDKDGKTLFRTSVTGFGSRDAAAAFCAQLKAAGKSCFVK